MEDNQFAMSGDDGCGGEDELDSDTDHVAGHREEHPDDFPEDSDAEGSDEGEGEGEGERYEGEGSVNEEENSEEENNDDGGPGGEERGGDDKPILDPSCKVHRGGPNAVAICSDPNCRKTTCDSLRIAVSGWRSERFPSYFHVKCVANIFDIEWHREEYRRLGWRGVWLGEP